MSNDNKQNKICNCQFSNNKDIFKPNVNHSFCDKCGSVLIKSNNGKIYYTIKPKQKIKPAEYDPLEIIKAMKSKTEKDYPYLNNEYNMDDMNKYNKDEFLKTIHLYLKHRKNIIIVLQKMMKLLDYNDIIFYQSLFFIDFYLSKNITENMSEKAILYYLVGFFLCAAKLKETDIYEPNLDAFCCIKKKTYLTVEKIAYYEIECLKAIKYNIFSYSAYDWLSELISVGFVFDCEINKNNSVILINGHRHSLINTISRYALKMLLNITVKDVFIKYSPMYIAFSLMQLSREKYLDKNCINTKLFNKLINLYGVIFNDYRKCYKELKAEIDEKPIEGQRFSQILEPQKLDENINKNLKASDRIEKNNILEIDNIKKLPQDDINEMQNHCKMDKNVVLSNKMRSSNVILHLKDNLVNQKEENKEDKDSNKINNYINAKEENIIKNNIKEKENKRHSKFEKKSENKTEKDNKNENKNENEIKCENKIENKNIKTIENEIKNENKTENTEKKTENKSKDEEDDDKQKDENIIVYEENNEEKNNNIKLKLDLNDEANEETDDTNNNKVRNSFDLSHLKNKSHLFINCTNLHKSNDNLPKVNPGFNHNYNHTNHLINEFKSLDKSAKCSSSKEIANKFLKTNQKQLNPIKSKRTMSITDKKKYTINTSDKCFIETNGSNGFKPKEELDSMKKSLFFANQKTLANLDISTELKKTSTFAHRTSNYNLTVTDNNTNNNENENKKKVMCKSKDKPKNNLAGKETKAYIPNKRNQSSNQMKRRISKSTLDAKNTNINKNNIQWKNN